MEARLIKSRKGDLRGRKAPSKERVPLTDGGIEEGQKGRRQGFSQRFSQRSGRSPSVRSQAEIWAQVAGTAQVGMADLALMGGQIDVNHQPNAAGQTAFDVHLLDIE